MKSYFSGLMFWSNRSGPMEQIQPKPVKNNRSGPMEQIQPKPVKNNFCFKHKSLSNKRLSKPPKYLWMIHQDKMKKNEWKNLNFTFHQKISHFFKYLLFSKVNPGSGSTSNEMDPRHHWSKYLDCVPFKENVGPSCCHIDTIFGWFGNFFTNFSENSIFCKTNSILQALQIYK